MFFFFNSILWVENVLPIKSCKTRAPKRSSPYISPFKFTIVVNNSDLHVDRCDRSNRTISVSAGEKLFESTAANWTRGRDRGRNSAIDSDRIFFFFFNSTLNHVGCEFFCLSTNDFDRSAKPRWTPDIRNPARDSRNRSAAGIYLI